MITCPNCGRENADNFNFCLDCGTELSSAPEPVATAPEPSAVQPSIPEPEPAIPEPAALEPMPEPEMPEAPVVDPAVEPMLDTPPPADFAPEPAMPTPAPIADPAPMPAPMAAELEPAIADQASSALSTNPNMEEIETGPPPPVVTSQTGDMAAVSRADAGRVSVTTDPPPAKPSSTQQAAAVEAGSKCPKCGANNTGKMKFCGECGSKLGDGAAQAPGAGAGSTMFLHAADMSALTQPKARLITIDQTGKEGMTFNLTANETLCGRSNGTILFFDDPFVSPTHCTFLFDSGTLAVCDHDSLNGVFLRVRAETFLLNEDFLRMGRQLFKLECDASSKTGCLSASEGDDARPWGSPDPQAWSRLVQILDDGTAGEVHLLKGEECRIGREIGDILLPNDGFISASHCALTQQDDQVVLRDLGSSNGTYVRIRGQRELKDEDFILIGNQMLRVELR